MNGPTESSNLVNPQGTYWEAMKRSYAANPVRLIAHGAYAVSAVALVVTAPLLATCWNFKDTSNCEKGYVSLAIGLLFGVGGNTADSVATQVDFQRLIDSKTN